LRHDNNICRTFKMIFPQKPKSTVMEKYILSLLFIFLHLNSFCQLVVTPPPSKPPTAKELENEEKNHNCLHRSKYSRLERSQFYPFNKTSDIKIVSFSSSSIQLVGEKEQQFGLPKANDTICYKKTHEAVSLTSAQIDSLTDILYNVGYNGPVHTISESECFNPRNAIVFLNKKGKILAYIEICFECERYQASNKQVTIGEICTPKYELLRKFFVSLGINYGTLTQPESE